jgi:nucleoid-associated protein YgaU
VPPPRVESAPATLRPEEPPATLRTEEPGANTENPGEKPPAKVEPKPESKPETKENVVAKTEEGAAAEGKAKTEEPAGGAPKTEGLGRVGATAVTGAAALESSIVHAANDNNESKVEQTPKTVPYQVHSGDNLWSISERSLKTSGNAHPTPEQIWSRVENIVEANKKEYPGLHSNPNLIKPGMMLSIPQEDQHAPHLVPQSVSRRLDNHDARTASH